MFKNLVLRLIFFLIRLPKNHSQDRILIVATTALGDTLWATPAIENIRKTFPNARLCVLTSPIGLEILQHNPHIDRLYLLRKPFSLWRKLYQEKFDTVLFFHASQRIAYLLGGLLGANRIIGTAEINKGLDSIFTHTLHNRHEHEIVRRLQIAEQIGAKTTTERLSYYLQPAEIIPKTSFTIALHPGSKDSFKRWPLENFAILGRMLDCNILITGTEKEAAELAAKIPGSKLLVTHSIREFAAHLNNVDLLISNDTGPVHLACALGRPVIALYSPTDPKLCGPHLAENAILIYKPPTCTPCLKRKCKMPFCMLQISPQQVFEKALEIYATSSSTLRLL